MVEYKVSTGRGGAGNIATSQEKPKPKMVSQGSQTPNLLQTVYSTGRGGAGNMRRNVDPTLTRAAQDVDDDDIIDVTSSNKSGTIKKVKSRRPSEPPKNISIGRGGAGNMLSPKSSGKTGSNKKEQGKVNDKKGKHGFLGKLKGFFV